MSTTPPSPPPADEWFYADAEHRQQGPVDHDSLLALYRQGQIKPETLVWKAGMENWQAFLQAVPLPPPDMAEVSFNSQTPTPGAIDTVSPAPPAVPAAPAVPGQAAAAMPAPPKKNGCLIAAIVLAVLGVIAIPVMGILAAIALPAYQDYTLRAKVAAVNGTLETYKQTVAAFHAEHGRCPVNGEAGIPERDAFPEANITDVYVGVDSDEDQYECIIAPTLTGFGNSALDDAELWWAYDADSGEWLCGSTAPDRVLPSICQG
ncbi:hypothetical protein CO614_06965 [Lysobacteraceae bacterium NML120232]|nr:hypothetical protein CO608_07670 [Xanthomonadaceae bacterium NML08-0793]PJK11691.1 hypothetical protein CO614_06965 [Xanthomonadaceae bacterium NML120232]